MPSPLASLICPVLRVPEDGDLGPLIAAQERFGWGGYIVFRAPEGLVDVVHRLEAVSDLPLLIASDIEYGAGQQLAGATVLPCAMALAATGDMAAVREAASLTAREARLRGVNWAFAPVADVNSNPRNPIINMRSFGSQPAAVAACVSAWVGAAQEAGLLACAKHFPGHGDTEVDSHTTLPTLGVDRAHLDLVEFPPFRAAIAAGAGSVMVGHLAVPALDPAGLPATLSRPVVTGLLREELGFDGLVVTDALIMGGVTEGWSEEDAVTAALEAGCDVLLMPPDPERALEALENAVRGGRVSPARVQNALARVARHREALRHLPPVTPATPAEGLAIAERLSRQALTLVHGDPGQPDPSSCLAVIVDDDGEVGPDSPWVQALTARGFEPYVLRPGFTREEGTALIQRAREVGGALLSLFSLIKAWKDRSDLGPELAAVAKELAETVPTTVISFSSPYLIGQCPAAAAYICAYGAGPAEQQAVVEALWLGGGFPGRLPVELA
ncbi:MAG: glycoside hydrolase family 3 N-terminal domain-containing protein [Candidatus Sericytochromatia bacterium]|nr:glycoside hydrolase family 3 N-terminal domain-containing protein [Candidatus Sericytochromatia bacterium]